MFQFENRLLGHVKSSIETRVFVSMQQYVLYFAKQESH